MAGITTHVLDTAVGQPVDGIPVTLYANGQDSGRVLMPDAKPKA